MFDHLITRSDPEAAHHVGIGLLEMAGSLPPLRNGVKAVFDHTDTSLEAGETFLPRRLNGRLGLAAGLDKDARGVAALSALGFGFVEVGTITPRPQPGNEKPRLWRLPETREIRNQMGFNNEGAVAAAKRLRRLRRTAYGRSVVVGANIGKNKVTPNDQAQADYEFCAKVLAPWVDFLVINVSSPNTPGLRDLQTAEALLPIVEATVRASMQAASRVVPVFVKIAPDLSDEDVLDIARMAKDLELAGVVAANTTINHDEGSGGISGPRLKARGLAIVSMLRQELHEDQTIIAVGGISTVDDALDYMDAGADLLEAYTAFIYEGPSWPGRINRELARALADRH